MDSDGLMGAEEGMGMKDGVAGFRFTIRSGGVCDVEGSRKVGALSSLEIVEKGGNTTERDNLAHLFRLGAAGVEPDFAGITILPSCTSFCTTIRLFSLRNCLRSILCDREMALLHRCLPVDPCKSRTTYVQK